MKFIKTILSIWMLLFLFSCGTPLSTINNLPITHPKNPIIIIPGMMGSQLVDSKNGNVIWGKVVDLKAVDPHEALIHPDVDGLELPIDQVPISNNRDGLVPTNILTTYEMINRIAEVEVYQGLIRRFSQCGLEKGDIYQCTARDNLYLFSYDWRRDIVETAKLLGERIKDIQKASDDPNQQVSFIAHSMGGLVAIYYLMYGEKDVLTGISGPNDIPPPDYAGAKNVNKVFFLGVPFEGIPYAFKTLHEGEYMGPFVYASQWATFTMPALYEMLPLNTNSMFVDQNNEPMDIDYFNADNWSKYGFSIFSDVEWTEFETECKLVFPDDGENLSHQRWFEFKNFIQSSLSRGKLFQHAVQKMNWDSVNTKNIVFSGNCYQTINRFEIIDQDDQKPLVRGVKSRTFSEKYYQTGKGDNTVLLESQLKTSTHADAVFFGCYKHRQMPNDIEIQNAILKQL